MSKLKVLVATPQLTSHGGVAALLRLLNLNITSGVTYFPVQIGGGNLKKMLVFTFLLPRFISATWNKKWVHFNPSMNRNSFWRDGMLLVICLLMGKKILVHWHGWNQEFFRSVIDNKLSKFFFTHTFLKADAIIVLASQFRDELMKIGVNQDRIHLLCNSAEPMDNRDWNKPSTSVLNVLFLSRIEKGKGLDLVIKTLHELQNRMNIHLDVAGTGSALEDMKALAAQLPGFHITFHGHVDGNEKKELLSKAHLLFQPSDSEGMPLTLIEAMFHGLYIAAKPVGGIPDWVDERHSILMNSDDYMTWANAIQDRFDDKVQWVNDIAYHYQLAQSRYTPTALKDFLFSIYKR
jgi:glycosyltransferase involved in cell wall biosynthesis